MEVRRCEDEKEDTTLEDKRLLFADLTFGKLSDDFEVREVDADPAEEDDGQPVVKREPVEDEDEDEEAEEHPFLEEEEEASVIGGNEPGMPPRKVTLLVTRGDKKEAYRNYIMKNGTPDQIAALGDEQEMPVVIGSASHVMRKVAIGTSGKPTLQEVLYTDEDKKEAYKKFILKNGTPEQIAAFYKAKKIKPYYSQAQKMQKVEELMKKKYVRTTPHIRICIVPNCSNRTDNKEGIKFFLVPRDNFEIRANWEMVLSTEEKPYVLPRHGLICCKHFQESQIITKGTGKLGLAKGTVPTLDLPRDHVKPHQLEGGSGYHPPLFTAKEIKREDLRAAFTLDDPCEEPEASSSAASKPKTREEMEEFGKSIVAQVTSHINSPYFPDLLKDIMNGLKLGKVVSTKMYDRWLACERKINYLNGRIKDHKTVTVDKVVEKEKKYAAILAENSMLKARLRRHDAKVEKLEDKVVNKKDLPGFIHEHLKPHFTLAQVKAYLRGNFKRASRISPEDYQRAKTLLEISPKAYEFLRRTKQLPLPSKSGLFDYHKKQKEKISELETQTAVSSIQNAEVLAEDDNGRLEQLAQLAAMKQEPARCIKCIGGVCDGKAGVNCLPPKPKKPRKRKKPAAAAAATGGGNKKTGAAILAAAGGSPAKKKKQAAKGRKGQQKIEPNSSPTREIIMHHPHFVETEVKPAVVYMSHQQQQYQQHYQQQQQYHHQYQQHHM